MFSEAKSKILWFFLTNSYALRLTMQKISLVKSRHSNVFCFMPLNTFTNIEVVPIRTNVRTTPISKPAHTFRPPTQRQVKNLPQNSHTRQHLADGQKSAYANQSRRVLRRTEKKHVRHVWKSGTLTVAAKKKGRTDGCAARIPVDLATNLT